MNDTNLLHPLRRFFEQEVDQAPKRNSLQTDDCPPLPLFLTAVSYGQGWDEKYRAHVSGCRYCQKTTAMQWRITHPNLKAVLGYLREGEKYPDAQAMKIHIEKDNCQICQMLQRMTTLEKWLANVRSGAWTLGQLDSVAEGSGWVFGELSPVGLHAPKVELEVSTASEEGPFVATLFDDKGELRLSIETADPAYENRKVTVETVASTGESRIEEVQLGSKGEYGIRGSYRLGKTNEIAKKVKDFCVLITPAEPQS